MKNKALFIGFAAFLVILIIILTESVTGGRYGQWFNTKKSSVLYSAEQIGNVSIVRRGTGYVLREDVGLIDGDKVVTSFDSSSALKKEDQLTAYLDEDVQVKVESGKGSVRLAVLKGTVFLRTRDLHEEPVYLVFEDALLAVENGAVFSAEIFTGTQTVNVYRGNVKLTFRNEQHQLNAGSSAILLQDEDGNSSLAHEKIKPEMLSAFLIGKLLNEDNVFFSNDQLNSILAAREAETKTVREARAAYEARVLAQGGTVPIISFKPAAENNAGAGEQEDNDDQETVYTCTTQLRCDTILDNLEALKEGKAAYVPEKGVILDTSKVEFVQGETVYDVLKKVCIYSGIPLDYEWTVKYGGYYIKGINNLYEFDCGKDSGWMYKVNGWYPNYGCSNYILKDGDVIEWRYTCDLGRDLGAELH